jgi:putative membrane protein
LVPDFLALPFLALHVAANVVWIGSILSVGWLCGRARLMADGAEIGRMARGLYLRFSVPAFGLSIVAGLARFFVAPGAYLRMHWMHGKLFFAIGVIALHHIIGARTKKVSKGDTAAGKGTPVFTIALLLAAVGAVALATMKDSLIP